MQVRLFFVIVLLSSLLAMPGSAAAAGGSQPAQPAPPPNSPVVQAFVENQAACNGATSWDVSAPTNAWIDVGIDWTARTEAIVRDNWPHILWEIAVDGRPVTDLVRYQHGPVPATISCPGFTLQGSRIFFKPYVPPLSVGDHVVTWKITITEDLSDGWFDYPAGTVIATSSTLHVAPPAAHR